MRPIDKKLKYQVDKVVRTAASGGTGKACDKGQWDSFLYFKIIITFFFHICFRFFRPS